MTDPHRGITPFYRRRFKVRRSRIGASAVNTPTRQHNTVAVGTEHWPVAGGAVTVQILFCPDNTRAIILRTTAGRGPLGRCRTTIQYYNTALQHWASTNNAFRLFRWSAVAGVFCLSSTGPASSCWVSPPSTMPPLTADGGGGGGGGRWISFYNKYNSSSYFSSPSLPRPIVIFVRVLGERFLPPISLGIWDIFSFCLYASPTP